MRCTASKLPRTSANWLATRLLGLCVLIAGIAAAQAPIVPTHHFGPPVCSPGRPIPHRMSADAATAEEQLGATNSHALLSAEPLENFQIQRYRLADYADCIGTGGCYWADLDAQYKRAEAALSAQVTAARPHDKLALVMDIDETTLSSYCEQQREDYGYIQPMFDAWVVTPQAAVAIPGALRLFNQARSAGVAVFFITGRPGIADPSTAKPQPDQTEGTTHNLETAGFHGWAGLALRNGPQNSMSTIAYKTQERGKIVAQGYRIIVSVGDQWSDLLGDPQAGMSVKLPNPFYFLP
jgi:hypothetical protein